jgi:hypothetical protein
MDAPRRARITAVLTPALVVVAALVGLLVGWYATDHTAQGWLYAFGGSAEFFGLVLVASPELVPIAEAVASSVRRAWRRFKPVLQRVENVVRRLLKRPRAHYVNVEPGGIRVTGGGVTGRVSPGADKTLEEKVEYLLRRDQETQAQFDQVERTVSGLPVQWRADIQQASEALRGEQAQALAELRDRHMRARVAGVLLLAVGVCLATAGNLVT